MTEVNRGEAPERQTATNLIPGLCSITFRPLTSEEVIERVVRAGLAGIEWGGDIHVPHGDLARAQAVARRCADAGVSITSYGSYWNAGDSEANGLPFAAVAETAAALGAPVVRVWAGTRDARTASTADRREVAGNLLRAAAIAQGLGLRIACEFHDGTVTSTGESTRCLLVEEAAHPALGCYWQPPHAESLAVCLDSLITVSPWLTHVHVFHWWPSAAERRPLDEGWERWRAYIAAMPPATTPRAALLEYLPDDLPGTLAREAATLRQLLEVKCPR